MRLSGIQAEPILRALVTRAGEWESHRLYSTWFGRLDQVLAVVMRSPRSYTGEDVAEIHTHGGGVVAAEVVRAALERGARLAQPGEFTLRAFMNGRLDLSQAEAVQQVIAAKTRTALGLAGQNLAGGLSARVDAIRERLLEWLARLEAEIDFGDEVEPLADSRSRWDSAVAGVDELVAGSEQGRVISEGVRTVLVGPPNAGKSTLLNLLLGTDRALVTPVPGTTRDTLEETALVGGVLLNLVDTAGLRASGDLVERLGMERTHRAVAEAELVVVVLDGSAAEHDPQLLQLGRRRVVLLNKSDLGCRLDLPGERVCLLEPEGQQRARQAIAAAARVEAGGRSETFSLTQRQLEALMSCRRALELVGSTLDAGLGAEFLCLDLRTAVRCLGEIRGLDVTEDVLDRIFSTFCLGK